MNLQSTMALYAYGTSEGAVKGWDKRGRSRNSPESTSYVSPNLEEGTNIEYARKALESERHLEFHNLAEESIKPLHGSVVDAIGEWKDGAEDSLVLHAKDFDQLEYQAAKVALAAHQKAFIAFKADPHGKDSIWMEDIGKQYSLDDIRKTLDSEGIENRTFTFSQSGTHVEIFDEKSGLQDNVLAIARRYHVNVQRKKGSGEFIGDDSRQGASEKYQQIVSNFEKRRGIHASSSGNRRRDECCVPGRNAPAQVNARIGALIALQTL